MQIGCGGSHLERDVLIPHCYNISGFTAIPINQTEALKTFSYSIVHRHLPGETTVDTLSNAIVDSDLAIIMASCMPDSLNSLSVLFCPPTVTIFDDDLNSQAPLH